MMISWPLNRPPGPGQQEQAQMDFHRCSKCDRLTGTWLYQYCQTWHDKNIIADKKGPLSPTHQNTTPNKSHVDGGACLPLHLFWCRIRKKKGIASGTINQDNVWYFWQNYVNESADRDFQQWLVDFNSEQDLFLDNIASEKAFPHPNQLANTDYRQAPVQNNARYAYGRREKLYRDWCLSKKPSFSPLPVKQGGITKTLELKNSKVFFPFDPQSIADYFCAEKNRYIALAFSGPAGAHAVAGWYNENMLGFFEPNYGEFMFPNVKEFKDTFIYIMSLDAAGVDYKSMRDECGAFRFF